MIFDRTGLIESELSLAKILDPDRHGYGNYAPYWANPGYQKTMGWSHANCAIQDPTDGNFLISLRHQDAVIKLTPQGELMLFDNGTASSCPPAPEQAIEKRESFVLCFRIDEASRTATETWRYGGQQLPFSHYVGGVCELPNGNRFIACTGIRTAFDQNTCRRSLDRSSLRN